jgi:hypothetical protein
MHPRRLLFVGAPRKAGPAPIYLAIAALLLVSLVGFVVVIWPEDSTASADRPSEGEVGPASQSFQGSLRTPPDARDSRGRMRWM